MPRNKKNNRNKSNQHSPMPHLSNVKKRPSIPPPPAPPPPPHPSSINDVSALRPTDREALFARLDSAIESAAEEDAGRIPKNLLIGPDLKVESAGKKRRIIPTPGAASALSHHSLTTTGSKTSAETAPVPVLSSPSSVSISMDSLNNSHLIDKSFSKYPAHIAPPTRSSHGNLEDVSSSVQSDPSSSLLLDQLHSAYPNTRSKHRQPPSSILSPETPPMELSTVSTGTIQKRATTGQQSLSPPHEQSISPKLPPLSLSGSVIRIEQCNDDALVISPTHTSQPLTSSLDDVGSIDRSSNEPIATTIAPSFNSAAITIDDDGPRQQSVSSAEKHRTSLDEPTGSNRPTKKRDESTNKDMGKPESKSTATGHHSSASHSSGSSSSPPPAPASPTRAGGRNKKEKPVFTTVASRIGSRRKQRAPEGVFTVLPPAPIASSTKDTKSTTKPTATSSALISGSVIEIDDDSGCDDNEHVMIIDDHPASTAASGSSASKMLATGSSTSSSHSERANSSIPNIPPTTSTTSTGRVTGPPVRLYVIPAFMDKLVYSLSRDRALQLKWEWLGPLEKTLSTDPRGNQDALPLDQERTTHIVTAFSDMDKVKKFFHVETINPKIEVVNNLWLTDAILYKRPMEPEGYRVAGSKPQEIISIKFPVVNSPPLHPIGAVLPEPGTEKQHRQAKFESVDGNESGEQQDFNDIILGIKEGSLEGGELSEDDHDPEQSQESEEDYIKTGRNDAKEKEAELSTGAAKLAPEVLEKLKKENRCFECQEQGHWANKCPKASKRGTKDEVLLQIISSGKSEGKRRSKILYRCQESHTAGQKDEPRYNKAILEQLKILMDHYETNKVKGSNEHFKVINYRKAITAIRALDYEITSEEMALKIPRVGKKLAQKIGECVALGRIKKLDHLNWDQEKSKTETLFRSVYGVGSEKATEWYNKGLRTLDDLKELPDLNKNQISGLKFYDDLMKRIPRSEVEQIGKVVEEVAHKLHPEIQSQVTGSYRRGKPDCGDIDIVVARPNVDNGDELFMIMDHILNNLINQGFLVDHLSLPVWEDSMATRPKHFKYMGICKLPGEGQIHRHIDILVVPWIHLGAVLIYFTGNDICNRSMRLLAANRGMRLSDKGLFDNVLRGKNRKKVNEGRWVAGRTEREIFDYLKIKYLEPYEREC